MDQPSHLPGTPCWFELGGVSGSEVRDHYAGLLGWTFDVNANVAGYARAFAGGAKVAGFGGPPRPRPGRGWRVYLAVPDLDAAAARARTAGGRVGAEVVVHDGRFAWFEDPWGTHTGLFDTPDDPGTSLDPGPGRVHGWSLASPAPDATRAWYTELFGPAFAAAVRLEQLDQGAGEWIVTVSGPPGGPVGDVVDPAGNVLRLVE